MDGTMRTLIGNLTADISDYYSLKPHENIISIISKLGGTVEESAEMNAYSEGRVRKRENGGFLIKIPTRQTPQQRKYLIAHELGHLFLHMGYKIEPALWENAEKIDYDSWGYSENEEQAAEFAMSLLMPAGEFKKVLDNNTLDNVVNMKAIAAYFEVSAELAARRGKTLGYLK